VADAMIEAGILNALSPRARARAPAASQPCRQQARAAGHGQAGWLVTGSLRGWGCGGLGSRSSRRRWNIC